MFSVFSSYLYIVYSLPPSHIAGIGKTHQATIDLVSLCHATVFLPPKQLAVFLPFFVTILSFHQFNMAYLTSCFLCIQKNYRFQMFTFDEIWAPADFLTLFGCHLAATCGRGMALTRFCSTGTSLLLPPPRLPIQGPLGGSIPDCHF